MEGAQSIMPVETKPPQTQNQQPGHETKMHPEPDSGLRSYRGSDKLKNKVALITGGDSGIGRAVAIAFAREGADVAFIYLNEHEDATRTRKFAAESGRQCLAISGDVGDEAFCQSAVESVFKEFGHLDILVNNAGEQHPQEDFLKLTGEQLERTFRTNLFSMFYLTKAALEHLPEGGAIVNTTSVTAYRGSPTLIDYSATKGAIVAFTRSLSKYLAEKKIRVNAVAPGPIWTPLIPSTFPEDRVKSFGKDTPMKRPGEPAEVAPCYVFLASNDSSYMTGQVLHPNGGEIVNG
jgi:NAD(P)-dependent dehydrogenase (short-subunit alcohol dehydrogenase family)